MKKRIWELCLLAAALLSLTGCFSKSLDELYALPAAPKDYENLQNKINEVVSSGGEPTAPVAGDKIQSVQLQDLDGDGVQEAIAFFRMTGDKPLKIYIFRQVGDDYQVAAVVEMAGTVINSIAYEDLDDVAGKELVVSWQVSDKVCFLAACSLDFQQQQVVELMRTNYTDYELVDLDRDNQQEIVVLQYNAEGGGRADLYNLKDGAVCLDSSAPLSDGINSIQEKKAGSLRDSVPALFVTSTLPLPLLNENAYITDILAWRNGKIENITFDEQTGKSMNDNIRYFYAAGCTDINGDSITEVPQPTPLREYKGSGSAVNFWLVTWRQFAVDGTSVPIDTTYYNSQDGWYFVLPDGWQENLVLSRNDVPGGGERGVVFYYWPGKDDAKEPVPFLSIYKLTGTNRQKRAEQAGRFSLQPNGGGTDVIYVAELDKAGWPECGLDEDGVIGRFHTIQTDWASG